MIALSDIFVKYGDRVLLDKVTITIRERERVGLVGRNGAGKSTLLKIISGESVPHGGVVDRPNGTSLGFLHQEIDLPSGKTVLEETLTAFDEVKLLEARMTELEEKISTATDYTSDRYMQWLQEISDSSERFALLGGETMEADAQRILSGLGFKSTDMNRPTSEFSGGWKMRVELAKMLLKRPDYLLLDEPTNHLDIESIIWLEQFLKMYEGIVIVISHDKTFLDFVTNRTIEVELGKLYDYKASYSKYMTLRAERREQMGNAVANQQKVIAQKERTISRFMAKANKTKMAQSMKKQLDKMERLEIGEEDTKVMKIRFPPVPRASRIMVDVKGIVKSFDEISVLQGVDFILERGERVAFVGQNGQGKTTLTKIILKLLDANSGTVELGQATEVAYYAQDQADALDFSQTVLETMEQKSPEHMRSRIRSILGSFLFSGGDVDKKVKVLSGGERARLAMACLLLRPINLLVLDEPTNHLDMLSKEVLKNAIKEFEGALIVVSHDREFLAGLTEKTIEFRDHQLYEHLGDVNYFLERRALENMREAEKRTKKSEKNVKKQETADPIDREKEKKIKNTERRIGKIEEEIKVLESKMSVEGFYTSADSQKILDKYDQLKKELENKMLEWEKLM